MEVWSMKRTEKARERRVKKVRQRVSGGRREAGQPREMRGRVWDDSSKEESKAGKFHS